MTSFDAWFSQLSDSAVPHEWQRRLAEEPTPRSRLIRIPTGMGKTLGVLAAWSWHRLHEANDAWPRRLVWCLPMRVLVEQTEAIARDAMTRAGTLWDPSRSHAGKVGIHLLMGGADPGGEWTLFPEESAVLVGTQDMLLSRALNRGYASGRARWPLEFGLLSQDALWVMDEVQLMDVGLATGAQLQAFHDDDAPKGTRPRHTWWMSATLQPAWLESVDTRSRHGQWSHAPATVTPAERGKGLGSIRKSLALERLDEEDTTAFAKLVLDQHRALADGEYGRITLAICNTVERACRTFDELRTLERAAGLELVHSRFRPFERAAWRARFLSRDACVRGVDRIIVATQVVEAGVDISAGCVVTELAPWPSLVQRFGRCARYGGSGHVLVVDRGREEREALPYVEEELAAAWSALDQIGAKGGVGTAQVEAFEEGLSEAARARLFPYSPRHLLLRRELDELFDTTPDLTGADLDISRFIRSGEERDLTVFWHAVPAGERGEPRAAPDRRYRPRREELCAIPFLAARDWLCGPETKTARKPRLRKGVRAWVWDWLDGAWVVPARDQFTPGRIVCVASNVGGYKEDRGFDPASEQTVMAVPLTPLPAGVETQSPADDSQDGEDLSVSQWKTIACHGGEVAEIADQIGAAVRLAPRLRELLALAGRWHDLGKAHPAFQGVIRGKRPTGRQDLAKAPKDAWSGRPGEYRTADDRDRRPGLRHELASAMALFAVLQRCQRAHPALLGPWAEALALTDVAVTEGVPGPAPTPSEQQVLACDAGEFDLVAYLVAAHHGKVRVALHAAPKDQDYRGASDGRGLPIRGIREGDELPSVALEIGAPALPTLRLTLEPACLGLSPVTGRSWRERTQALLDRFGPGALAWLEALLIAADRRASQLATADPVLSSILGGRGSDS